MRKNKRGFTLIEMLVVIAIIGILATMITPAIGRARERARRAKCMNNMKQIGYLISLYQMDHNEQFPDDSSNFQTLVDGLEGKVDNAIFLCPSDDLDGEASPTTCSYTYKKPGINDDDSVIMISHTHEGVHGGQTISLTKGLGVVATNTSSSSETEQTT
ncbi:type II secretion system GspH family protein [bacterium]|nr:type II secretion system GspH family protein [bacterium]